MPNEAIIHYDNRRGFSHPYLWVWYDGSGQRDDLGVCDADDFGPVYRFVPRRSRFRFKFKEGAGADGPWEADGMEREGEPLADVPGATTLWARADNAFVYRVRPRDAEAGSAATFLRTLTFRDGLYVPGSGGYSGLGANALQGGGVLFGLYHPNAARVHVFGEFNNWQRPGHDASEPARFHELRRYRGWFGEPNLWLGVVKDAAPGQEYKFMVQGGVPLDDKRRPQRYLTDPYARRLGPSFQRNNAVVVDPGRYRWGDDGWHTPAPDRLIIYEMSVYGFTEGDPDIEPDRRGRFSGVSERISTHYFDRLGVTALSIMPLAEFPSQQGPETLGYDPSLYCTVERDFGSPDELRELIDTAHRNGLAVLLDEVFNHTSNNFNPLWQAILEHPGEEASGEGGVYFAGNTPWGNRVATEKVDVQNLLIDACKLFIREYHVDGFRFDATHSYYMDHGFLHRLLDELRGFKPDVLLIAENLPNQGDLNRSGFDGFAQWCDPFHDKVKALLREGEFEGSHATGEGLGAIFYFSRDHFAAHTNNVVNYCESHDEHSVPHEVGFNPVLSAPDARSRKGRLGLFATAVALGQPMIYMGQEFNVERARNRVDVQWPGDLDANGDFQWASRLLRLRRRYPGLRVAGYDPAADGRFEWIVAPWLDNRHGGGRRVIGWRTDANGRPYDRIVVLLNFEGGPVEVDVEFGSAGRWVKLADIDRVNDIAPEGDNNTADPTVLHSADGHFAGFVLPSSSGFVYKWEAE